MLLIWSLKLVYKDHSYGVYNTHNPPSNPWVKILEENQKKKNPKGPHNHTHTVVLS